ncbi:MAG: hypothetical protein WC356_05015 [Candidatus Micrarchaeia archaeon]|jgi:DNA replication protein DnaC
MFEADKKKAAEEVARRIGIGPKEIPYWYDAFHPEVERAIKESIKLETAFPPSFILAGPVGTGKSGLLSAGFKDWVMQIFESADGTAGSMISGVARYCIFLTYDELLDVIMAEVNDNDVNGIMTVGELSKVPFVIIDDLFKRGTTPWQMSRLEDLIEYRYDHGLSTWFSTNLDAKDLKPMPGFQRSYSRLADHTWCRFFQLNGADRRKMKMSSGQPPAGKE